MARKLGRIVLAGCALAGAGAVVGIWWDHLQDREGQEIPIILVGLLVGGGAAWLVSGLWRPADGPRTQERPRTAPRWASWRGGRRP